MQEKQDSTNYFDASPEPGLCWGHMVGEWGRHSSVSIPSAVWWTNAGFGETENHWALVTEGGNSTYVFFGFWNDWWYTTPASLLLRSTSLATESCGSTPLLCFLQSHCCGCEEHWKNLVGTGGHLVVQLFLVGPYLFLWAVSLREPSPVEKVCLVSGRELLFTEWSSLLCVCGYQVLSLLWGVNCTRWAFNLQLDPHLCEQVDKPSRIKVV